MNLLIAAATQAEIAPLLAHLQPYRVAGKENSYKKKSLKVRICITGVGSVPTTYRLVREISAFRPDLAIQAGIAGCFSREVPLGSLYRVSTDRFADLGAEQGDMLLDVFDLGLLDKDEPPFADKKLPASVPEFPVIREQQEAEAITVNMVSGHPATIGRLQDKYAPLLESMEGAAFHYVCLLESVNFVQVRTVSNYVAQRDKTQWDIPLAVQALNSWLIECLEKI
jgi:futalosine hydrolase